jgi:transposase
MESVESALLPLPEAITLLSVHPTPTSVIVQIACQRSSAACPHCQQPSARVHGHYTRTVADLPCAGRRIVLQLTVRKFVCRTATCPQQIFTERLAALVQSYARMTNRLRDAFQALGMTTGGESGERLAPKLGMCVSAPTLLRQMRSIALPPPDPVRLLGVDDWAWKRGQTYGTILVDLERHRPIDLLPDRTSSTTEAWLRAHPDVEWVSRDRSGEYAAAARAGAPQASQVADKFHLLKNLREALQELLERKQPCLPEVGEDVRSEVIPPQVQGRGAGLPVPLAQPEPPPTKRYLHMSAQPRLSPVGMSAARVQQQVRRDNRYARDEAARTLYQQGYTIRAIARRLGHCRETITRYVQAVAFPERAPAPKRGSILDPYKPYLLQRWQEGCHNGVQLLAEITARGYQGSRPLLSLFLADLRKKHQLVGDPQALRLGLAHPHKKASILDPYKPYVLQRWKEGCWNGMQLYEEIKAQGFTGSQPTLRDFLAELRKQQCLVADPSALRVDQAPLTVVVPTPLPPKREVTRRMSPARASWLLFLPTERLTERKLEQRERLRGCHPDVEAAFQVVSTFVTMLAERRAKDLEGWLSLAAHSHLPELKRFATGIRRDEAAVRAAFSSDISNGQTEGQVLRLKLIKRSMFGRANFDLLRLRFLYRA